MSDVWDEINAKYPGKLKGKAVSALRLLDRGIRHGQDTLNVDRLQVHAREMKMHFLAGDEVALNEAADRFVAQLDTFKSLCMTENRPFNTKVAQAVRATTQKLRDEHWANLSLRDQHG